MFTALHAKQQKKPSPFYSSAVEILPKPDEAHEIISVPLPDETNEDLYQASILIQRVIEGRAIQTLVSTELETVIVFELFEVAFGLKVDSILSLIKCHNFT